MRTQRHTPTPPTLAPRKRCAVYTRKSTDEGLDMEYNSLEAQRDAGLAYIAMLRPTTTRPTPSPCYIWPVRWPRRGCDMKVPQYRYRCPLGNLQPTTPDLDAVKREGWRNDHILVVSEHDNRLDWVEKEFVRRLGERLYGEGGKRHG